jgi:hypothetical protein
MPVGEGVVHELRQPFGLVDEACDQGDDGGVVAGSGAAAFSERGHGVVDER